jgi:hypothetical protein
VPWVEGKGKQWTRTLQTYNQKTLNRFHTHEHVFAQVLKAAEKMARAVKRVSGKVGMDRLAAAAIDALQGVALSEEQLKLVSEDIRHVRVD